MYIPLALLVAIYAIHSFGGFSGSAEFYEIISVLGFSSTITSALVFFIGPWDGSIALLLLFRPNKWVFLLAGLWPWIPRVFEFMGGLEPEYIDAIVVSLLATLAYYLFLKKKKWRSAHVPIVV